MTDSVSKNDVYRYQSGKRARKRPVGMLPSEVIRIETAMLIGQVSDRTIRRWATIDGIGRQSNRSSPLQVSAPALCMKLDGDMETIERLRNGERFIRRCSSTSSGLKICLPS